MNVKIDVTELENLGEVGQFAIALLNDYVKKIDAQHNQLLATFSSENVLIIEKGSVSANRIKSLPYEVIQYKPGTTPPKFITRER